MSLCSRAAAFAGIFGAGGRCIRGGTLIAIGLLLIRVGAAVAEPGSLPTPRTGFPEALADWVRFHASFDSGARAELAGGSPDPSRILGTIQIEKGHLGNGILMGPRAGGAQLRYTGAGNLDLARPGALSFWVSPKGWTDPETQAQSNYVRFLGVSSRGPGVFAIQRERRERKLERERFLAGFLGRRAGDRYVARTAESKWRDGSWHLVVVSWDATGFAISFDGEPLVRRAVDSTVLEDWHRSSTDPGIELVVGSGEPEAWILDELTIYARPLRDQDVDRILDFVSREAR